MYLNHTLSFVLVFAKTNRPNGPHLSVAKCVK